DIAKDRVGKVGVSAGPQVVEYDPLLVDIQGPLRVLAPVFAEAELSEMLVNVDPDLGLLLPAIKEFDQRPRGLFARLDDLPLPGRNFIPDTIIGPDAEPRQGAVKEM